MPEDNSVLIENADKSCRTRFNSPNDAIQQMQEDCGYDPEGECGVDELIDYKNALEDFAYALLDQLAREQADPN